MYMQVMLYEVIWHVVSTRTLMYIELSLIYPITNTILVQIYCLQLSLFYSTIYNASHATVVHDNYGW